jgi:hypothetical protein
MIRNIAFALVVFVLSCLPAHSAEQGIKFRFVISAKHTPQNASQNSRTYENAVLMSFGKAFSADFEEEFRFSLKPVRDASDVVVDLQLHDLKRGAVRVGEKTVRIVLGRSTDVLLSESVDYRYSVFLTTELHDLTK